MKTTRQIRTIFRTERSRLLGMEMAISRPVRRSATLTTGR